MSEPSEPSEQACGQVLFDFVRHWSRRSMNAEPGLAERGRLVQVCEAVDALTRRKVAPTVNAIAHDIGIDQSGASRLVKSAVSAGHLVMAVAERDGRRREVALTPAGRSMLAHARDWQNAVFDELSQGWSQERRREFQAAMTDLMDRSHALDT